MSTEFQQAVVNAAGDFKKQQQLRFAVQQNMRANSEIYKAGIEMLPTPSEDFSSNAESDTSYLYEMIVLANDLAMATAEKVLQRPRAGIQAPEFQPFRDPAARIVAQHWKSGKLNELNVEKMSNVLAEAANSTKIEMEYSVYDMTPEQSVMCTTTNIAGQLLSCVMDYQFRTDVMTTLNRLTDAVLEEANKSVKTLNNGNDSLHHKSTPLFQSFINQHTANLVTCYQTQAAKTAGSLQGKSDEEIQAYFEANDPINDVIEKFKKWAVVLTVTSYTLQEQYNNSQRAQVQVAPAAGITPRRRG